LAPHHGEDAELGPRGRAAENLQHPPVLVARQAMLRGQRGGDLLLLHVAIRAGSPRSSAIADRNRARPSSPPLPSSASTARSGWGMRPTTLPRALVTPAMFCCEPLGLAAADASPSGVT